MRIKSLLPESIVPGWFLVVATPLYALILLLVFILVNQVAGNLLLIFGVLLLIGRPRGLSLSYAAVHTAAGLTGTAPADRSASDAVCLVSCVAMLLLLIYVSTVELFGRPLVGTEANQAIIGAGRMLWEATKFMLNYIARSMFITAVAIDLFMYVNLSVWKNTKAFNQTPEAEAYDRLMGSFQAATESPQSP